MSSRDWNDVLCKLAGIRTPRRSVHRRPMFERLDARQLLAGDLDTNQSGNVTPVDALIVANEINSLTQYVAPLDVNGDGLIDTADFNAVLAALAGTTGTEANTAPANNSMAGTDSNTGGATDSSTGGATDSNTGGATDSNTGGTGGSTRGSAVGSTTTEVACNGVSYDVLDEETIPTEQGACVAGTSGTDGGAAYEDTSNSAGDSTDSTSNDGDPTPFAFAGANADSHDATTFYNKTGSWDAAKFFSDAIPNADKSTFDLGCIGLAKIRLGTTKMPQFTPGAKLFSNWTQAKTYYDGLVNAGGKPVLFAVQTNRPLRPLDAFGFGDTVDGPGYVHPRQIDAGAMYNYATRHEFSDGTVY